MSPRGWGALNAHIDHHPLAGTPAEMRAAFEQLAPPSPPAGQAFHATVPCALFGPASGRPVVWVHGGGLVFGSSRSHGAMAEHVAQRSGRTVIVPDYRLAPENPWPAPLDDVLAVLDALPGPVDLVGDSVGGQMALLATLRRPGRVGRLALISPNTDRTGASTTRAANSPRDAMNDDGQDLALARMAFGDDIARHPDASPLFASLGGLPPVWITAATNEVLLDDTLLLVAALGRAGVEVTARIRAGLCHLWPLWPEALDEGRETLDELADLLAATP